MSLKKLLLISNKVYHYRVPIYNHLNSRLKKIGYELVVMTNELQADNPNEPEFSLIIEPFGFVRYTRAIKDIGPKHVMLFLHIRDIMVWPLMLWMKFRRTKFIYWNHGINLQDPHNVVKNLFFGTFHALSDAIVLYSRNEEQFIGDRHRRKTFCANNTLDFGSFPEVDDSKESIRRDLGIEYDRVVLFVGRIIENKRLGDLIDAAKYLRQGTGVVIVGGGLSADQAKSVRRSENITYLGEIYDGQEINRIFRMADVFCIPGSMGLGINQAFYWGLPTVTGDVLHSPEIMYLEKGKNGFIVGAGDIRALAEKLNYLTSSDEIYEAFSAAAKSAIMTKGSIDTMCDGFLDAIEYLDRHATTL